MKTLLKYFKHHFQDNFNWQLHLMVMLFCFVCLCSNFFINWWEIFDTKWIEGNFEDDIIDGMFRGKLIYFLVFFLFYCFAYFGTSLICIVFTKDWEWLRNREFWVISTIGLAIISFDIGFYWDAAMVKWAVPPQIYYFSARVFDRLVSLFTNVLPLFILWKITQQPKDNFYGLTLKGGTLKPYFLMIALMLPLLVWASYQPDFLRQYPTYRDYGATAFLQIPEWVTVLIYEIGYGSDFISVELFFRGFLVIGMVSIIGKKAILPMAVLYCFVHFGKPFGEALSSFFGGYILGVLAYYTRNIFGGLIVHLGIAWLMEILAFGQAFFNSGAGE
jgi:hypothetical protein